MIGLALEINASTYRNEAATTLYGSKREKKVLKQMSGYARGAIDGALPTLGSESAETSKTPGSMNPLHQRAGTLIR